VTATSARINPADHLPDYVSPAQIKGLLGNLDIWRDTWGIPHVRGGTFQDAFAGLGFAQAQDRLWQMEALLRRGTGRYAEWLGTRAVAGDVIARQLNGEAASRRDYALLGDEAQAMLKAYARGVNAFIALRRWPVEYKILGCEPASWEPWHSIAVMRQIGFLMGSVWWKLWRAAALPIVGADNIAKQRCCACRRAWRANGSPPPSPISNPASPRCWRPRRSRWAPNWMVAATIGRSRPN
jgi:penicillin amidase